MNITSEAIQQFITTERIIGNVTRILGSIAKSFIPPVSDDSHTNLLWCNTNKHLITRTIVLTDGRHLNVSFHPGHLHIHFEIEGEHTHNHIVLLKGNSINYIQNRVIQFLNNFGLDGDEINSHLKYRYPELNDVAGKLPKLDSSMIKLFENIRCSANNSLSSYLVNNKIEAELPRVWPHNFDTGIFCVLKDDVQQYAGYAPADDKVCPVPYFYNSFYKNSEQLIGTNVLEHAEWQTNNWKGAVLRLDSFNSVDDFLAASTQFLNQSSKSFLK